MADKDHIGEAKRAKNDEFCPRIDDVEAELRHDRDPKALWQRERSAAGDAASLSASAS